MDVNLNGSSVDATPNSASKQLFDGGEVPLAVSVGADEQLVEASVSIDQWAGAEEPAFSSPTEITSNKGASLSQVDWVSLDWGSSRTVESITLAIALVPANFGIRARIAVGGTQWYSPPGPTMLAVTTGTNKTVVLSFPTCVADRIMLEFLNTDTTSPSAFQMATVSGVPTVNFGQAARDVECSVDTGRPFFRLDGQVSNSNSIPNLFETIKSETKVDEVTDSEVTLSLQAGVAGLAGLTWSFVRNRILREFASNAATHDEFIEWNGSASVPLLDVAQIDGVSAARFVSLTIDVQTTPSTEYLVLGPQPNELSSASGELLKPLHTAAQRIELGELADPLVGVSLRVRASSATLTGEVQLVQDLDGLPNGDIVAQAPLAITDITTSTSTWLNVDFAEPCVVSGQVWVVTRIDEGELAWMHGVARDEAKYGPAAHKKNDVAWLPRRGIWNDRWALLRIRGQRSTPPPNPTFSLNVSSQDSPIPLSFIDGSLSFESPDDIPLNATTIRLNIESEAQTSIVLSNLDLRWREAEEATGGDGSDAVA